MSPAFLVNYIVRHRMTTNYKSQSRYMVVLSIFSGKVICQDTILEFLCLYLPWQCGKPFFPNTCQNGEWTVTITRQVEKELAMFGE